MIPQFVFVIKVNFTSKTIVVVQAPFIVPMEAMLGLEYLDVMRRQDLSQQDIYTSGKNTDLIVLSAIPVFVIHMLPP